MVAVPRDPRVTASSNSNSKASKDSRIESSSETIGSMASLALLIAGMICPSKPARAAEACSFVLSWGVKRVSARAQKNASFPRYPLFISCGLPITAWTIRSVR